MLTQASATHIPLPDGSVHSVITSPPYYGLRSYAGNQLVDWPAGDYAPCTGAPPCMHVEGYRDAAEYAACRHEWTTESTPTPNSSGGPSAKQQSNAGSRVSDYNDRATYTRYCRLCGAMRCGLGAEPDPSSFVWHTLLWLRECRRVLRDDGTCWVNLGDSFASGEIGRHDSTQSRSIDGRKVTSKFLERNIKKTETGLPQGNLIGIPARVMLAAQADGWTVRNDCIFAKVAPMPESVSGWRFQSAVCECVRGYDAEQQVKRNGYGVPTTYKTQDKPQPDPSCPICHGTGRVGEPQLRSGSWRHTRSHEFVFQLTKGMGYFADGEAVREPNTTKNLEYEMHKASKWGIKKGQTNKPNLLDYKNSDNNHGYNVAGRNPRSVLTPAPSPFSGAHFATFPRGLVRPLLLASVPKRCCSVCGAGWAAVVETGEITSIGGAGKHDVAIARHELRTQLTTFSSHVLGYRPTCSHTDAPPVAGIVLDPFTGSGTTLMVARELGLRAIGLDISHEYLHEQAAERGLGVVPERIEASRIAELPMFAGS